MEIPATSGADTAEPPVTDNPKSTFARRVSAANSRVKRHDIRDDLIPG